MKRQSPSWTFIFQRKTPSTIWTGYRDGSIAGRSYKETMLKNKNNFLKKCLVFLLRRKLFRPSSYMTVVMYPPFWNCNSEKFPITHNFLQKSVLGASPSFCQATTILSPYVINPLETFLRMKDGPHVKLAMFADLVPSESCISPFHPSRTLNASGQRPPLWFLYLALTLDVKRTETTVSHLYRHVVPGSCSSPHPYLNVLLRGTSGLIFHLYCIYFGLVLPLVWKRTCVAA